MQNNVLIIGGDLLHLIGTATTVVDSMPCAGLGQIYQVACYPMHRGLQYYFQAHHLMSLEPPVAVQTELLAGHPWKETA